ncbi:unnamed protein product, partial [Ectocarpus fasciculatus]
ATATPRSVGRSPSQQQPHPLDLGFGTYFIIVIVLLIQQICRSVAIVIYGCFVRSPSQQEIHGRLQTFLLPVARPVQRRASVRVFRCHGCTVPQESVQGFEAALS